MAHQAPGQFLPLTPQTLNVLLTLGDGRLHPYAIMQELEKRTSGQERLLPGSLYSTVARMVREGLLEELGRSQESKDSRRREYRATSLGKAVAEAEVARLQRLVEFARSQKLLEAD